ncbi:hypothetical protein QBC36DRAFT_306117 [Triangularia setosa]|uniref:Myosin class II heavy chain n=1 Tax=Triangularia setosa TaxID=2587417 RepID=A0AAN7AC48_9PEZI|nr:hypothetical protein QBC36DRAFT_306117 [Podospora setosa]
MKFYIAHGSYSNKLLRSAPVCFFRCHPSHSKITDWPARPVVERDKARLIKAGVPSPKKIITGRPTTPSLPPNPVPPISSQTTHHFNYFLGPFHFEIPTASVGHASSRPARPTVAAVYLATSQVSPENLTSEEFWACLLRRYSSRLDNNREPVADDAQLVCAGSRPGDFLKTSSLKLSPQTPPRALAQDGSHKPNSKLQDRPSPITSSPALSNASTADGEASPVLPPLPVPRLPDRVRGLLRTPSPAAERLGDEDNREQGLAPGATGWGSPYPSNLRTDSTSSSEISGDSPIPIHRLQLQTPFLRPAPLIEEPQPEPPRQSSLSAAAAVLANRARRIAHGITEDWIRQHTAAGGDQEKRHWFSDGTGDSENSSLSGSFSGEEAAWLGYDDIDIQTPRPRSREIDNEQWLSSGLDRRKQSSNETLRQAHLDRAREITPAKMAYSDERATPDSVGNHAFTTDSLSATQGRPNLPERPGTPTLNGINGSTNASQTEHKAPSTPSRAAAKRASLSATPRAFRKKVPWKGKNIMVSFPSNDRRGQPGGPPMPLTETQVKGMLRSWEELGYTTDGFDLASDAPELGITEQSHSKGAWPDFDDVARERQSGKYPIVLPDLNAWKKYVDELNEAKLRALGVSFGDDEPPLPPPPAISPATTMSRQTSMQYPPLPFSPPIPTSSASSNQAVPGFPFNVPFVTSATQSPGISAGASPVPFNKFNPRASISVPSPHGWSPSIMLGHRVGSPSLANLSAMMSPTSPFSPDGMGPVGPVGHQRHQSLQFPVLPHQFQVPVRASPRLQDLCEIDEEPAEEEASKHPEPGFVHHNASDSLQKEIDEAEYHLEEQMRSQLDNDEDYSPHNENDKGEMPALPSVQFAAQPPQFGQADGLVLHHPRPHSRGHSLSQKFYTEEDATVEGGYRPTLQGITSHLSEDSEIETNPSNLGTPVQGFDFAKIAHQRTLSNGSNPWHHNESERPAANGNHQPRVSHGSKSSFSKLNVEAPEFKFNPTSTFTPGGGFAFSNSSFTTPVFNAGLPQMVPNPFGMAAPMPAPMPAPVPAPSATKINVNAAPFSPGSSDFSFSSSGPKFRPDAPAFTPTGMPGVAAGAVTNVSKPDSIFGSIDLSAADIAKPAKNSQAVPIVKPEDEQPDEERDGGKAPGQYTGEETRSKRARASVGPDDDIALFAERTEDPALVVAKPETIAEDEGVAVEDKSFDESNNGQEDTAQSSMVISATPDTEAAISPSETSPDQATVPWAPFEFNKPTEMQAFAEAAPPFEPGSFKADHKKSLSATAKAFIPGVPVWEDDKDTTPEATLVVAKDEQAAVDQETTDTVVESIERPEEDLSAPSADTTRSVEKELPPAPKGLAASRYAQASPPPPPPPKQSGLSASRFASVPSPRNEKPPREVSTPASSTELDDKPLPSVPVEVVAQDMLAEPTMADLDEIMRRLNENPDMAVKKTYNNDQHWTQADAAPPLGASLEASLDAPLLRSEAPNPKPGSHRFDEMGEAPRTLSVEPEDAFNDQVQYTEGAVQHLNGSESPPASDWEGTFTEDEQTKLESRVKFFDGRVNELVDGLLAARLKPLEQLVSGLARTGRQLQASQPQHSVSDTEDGDDEEDGLTHLKRPTSPRRDRRMQQIRTAVSEALAAHQKLPAESARSVGGEDSSRVLATLEEMKTQLNVQADIGSIVEEVLERRIPPAAADKDREINQLHARLAALEQRLHDSDAKLAAETAARRAAEDSAARASRELENAATKIDVEMMNKSSLGQRINDLEERVHHAEHQVEEAVNGRRAAEDRLAENQRLLRISSEEETRLRETVDTKDADLNEVRKESQHWRNEATRIAAIAQRRDKDLAQALDENKALHKLIETLGTQVEENERVRDNYRSKLFSLQEDMANAAKDIAEENAHHAKREQSLVARQEVLEARLQAEARTRERIETELQRLEMGERQGMRAVAECKRLEATLVEIRSENHKLHQSALRYQAEFEEARESAAREVQRTREAMQSEIDAANHQVNVARDELEDQMARLRGQLDQVKMDADTAKARLEMLLEEAQTTKQTELEALIEKHQNEVEDLQVRYDRQLGNTTEDAHRTEQNLLERLSISTSRSEHLQDRVAHLEEKLEIAKEAARAAAQAAKSSVGGSELPVQASAFTSRELGVPEKISPQALRESIMVLQEQLQEREQRIEELDQKLAKVDPEAETKISKRDDEIIWLRELLAVRHSDLQDIIAALGREDYDKNTVKDAAIRLKANLQMEEQERERALNGGSAINLPNIAATIREAATPRVAQAVGPLAAAWGNWRRSRDPSFGAASSVQSPTGSASGSNVTPSRSSPAASSFLGGLLTPPASGLRQTPTAPQVKQPTAFSSTGRRFTPQDLANRPLGPASAAVQQVQQETAAATPAPSSVLSTPPRRTVSSGPVTPPMRENAYDSDAQDFDDAEFFGE